ncbi:MAG: hypothetical protein KDB22_17360 [Planctomycetales bacterium]|nr:hypothetical protein [Planctomycetales bacterium]
MTTGAATGALAQLLQPEVQLLHPESQTTASQQLLLFFLNSLLSRPPLFLDPQPLSQPMSHPQGSQEVISHPQEGAAAQGSQEAISHPQLGAAPHPQGSVQPVSQQEELFLLQSLANNSFSGRRRGLLQPVSHPQGSQAATSHPQLGAAPHPHAESTPQLGSHAEAQPPQADSTPQLGSQADAQPPQADSTPQLGSQADAQPPPHAVSQPQEGAATSQPQLGSAAHPVSQHPLSHPLPFRPSIRSNNPPPKLGVHRLEPSTRDPTKMFHFIESQLPKR